jgi:hypothetical protein
MTNIRTQNICNARNKLLNYLNNLDYKIDYFIMMDFDDVSSKKINIEVLSDCLKDNNIWVATSNIKLDNS